MISGKPDQEAFLKMKLVFFKEVCGEGGSFVRRLHMLMSVRRWKDDDPGRDDWMDGVR